MSDQPDTFAITTGITRKIYGVGLLGAVVNDPRMAEGARLHEIERRILRIEMALRRTGIEVEMTEFPEVRS